MELRVDVAGDVQLARSFSRFADDVKDLSDAFREIAKDFHEVVERKQFESEGSYGSGGWAALSPDYAEQKARDFPGRPLLVRTGLMKESLLGENPWSIEDIQPLQMKVGTKLEYAIYHQKKTSKMPARPVIDLTEEDKRRFTHIIHKSLVAQAKEAGLL